MSTPCKASRATMSQYWETLPGTQGFRNRATGKICKNLEITDWQAPVERPKKGNDLETMANEDANGKKQGLMDPSQFAIDTTNPLIKGLLEALVAQATNNMQNPRAGGNQFVGPTAQLFPQGLQRFNPSNVGAPNVPGGPGGPSGPGLTPPAGPPGPSLPINRPPIPPGTQPPPTRRDPRMGGPDPRVQPGTGRTPVQTDGRRGRQSTASRNFSPTEQLLAEMGLLGEEFQPVSSGSRYLNSFQPQYINQFTGARRF